MVHPGTRSDSDAGARSENWYRLPCLSVSAPTEPVGPLASNLPGQAFRRRDEARVNRYRSRQRRQALRRREERERMSWLPYSFLLKFISKTIIESPPSTAIGSFRDCSPSDLKTNRARLPASSTQPGRSFGSYMSPQATARDVTSARRSAQPPSTFLCLPV